MKQHTFYGTYGKRWLDIVFSGLLIIVLSPVLLLLTVLVRIKHGSPVFFSPTRPGKHEKVFHIYKFRTMSNKRDENGILLPDKDRLTRFGKIMRATSLDELPELFNIFRGDMSFVGPRPLGKNTLPAYSEQHRLRFEVRPGLTGLAQVRGRNGLDWNKRFQYDLDYIDHLSLGNDIKILFETAVKVIKREDVTIPGTTELLSYNTTRKYETEGKIQPVGSNGKRMEIGGDFWLDTNPAPSPNEGGLSWLPQVQDSTLTFAGRASIELALLDIQSKKKIRKAYVPSYCSFGLLQPFFEQDIPYEFYDVVWANGRFIYKIDPDKPCDVILIMNYFGSCYEQTAGLIDLMHKKGCVVIEDITHTLLDKRAAGPYPDYYVASLRKWFAIPTGGWLGKVSGTLAVKPDEPGDDKTGLVVRGMQQKAKYIAGESDDKKSYIVDISSFEEWLVLLNCKTRIDETSEQLLYQVNVLQIAEQQRKNARHLYNRLRNVDGIEFINAPKDWEENCPLCVPVLLSHEKRNAIQLALRDQGIYCPVTWPERMGAASGIRDNELSLICDYRYGEQDMDRIAETILSIMK